MRTRPRLLPLSLVAILLLLATCGDDPDEALGPPSTEATPTEATPTEATPTEATPTEATPTESPTTETTAPEPSSDGGDPATTPTPAPSADGRPAATPSTATTAPLIASSGPAPWTVGSLDVASLPEVYRLEWAEAGEPSTCPFLAFADLGPEAEDAEIRRAENDREMLVAWDNPDGPGHDRRGEPCADCGRGVVGLGTFQRSGYAVGPATIAWDDGSFANVAELPWVYGVSARIQPAGADCMYQLWSHLGYDHVEYLIGQLREVAT